MVNGKEWQAALFDRSPRAVGTLFEAGGDDNGKPPYMGPNNYEACLKFTANGITRYYGGGMPGLSFDTKELVLSAAFPALVWVSLPPALPGRHVSQGGTDYQGGAVVNRCAIALAVAFSFAQPWKEAAPQGRNHMTDQQVAVVEANQEYLIGWLEALDRAGPKDYIKDWAAVPDEANVCHFSETWCSRFFRPAFDPYRQTGE